MSSGKILRRPAVLLMLCLVSVGVVVTLLGRLASGPAAVLKPVELTGETGSKAYPSFSPDGQMLAYSGRAMVSKDEVFHVFVRPLPQGKVEQLTRSPGSDISPVWSPDGKQIAFVRLTEGQGECVVIASSDGAEQHKYPGCIASGDETEPMPAISWTRDGQSLVVVQAAEKQPASLALLSLADGSFKPLTHAPAGKEDSSPTVSPDGNSIAFVRSTAAESARPTAPTGSEPTGERRRQPQMTDGQRSDLFICKADGSDPQRITFDDRTIRGVAWSRDGQELIYTANRAHGWRLYHIAAYGGGSPRDMIFSGRRIQYVAVSPAGKRLVYDVSPTVSSIWRARLGSTDTDHREEHAIIRSQGNESMPRYSPDGKSIATVSDQTGNDEIWISDADGGNRVQVTSLKGSDIPRLRWSYDGKQLVFDTNGDKGDALFVVAAAANSQAKQVQTDAINGSWSHDGKSIYYQADGQIWKMPADGGKPVQLSKAEGAGQPVESVDGKYVYFRSRRSFWRVPAAGGEEEQVFVPEHDLGWSTTIQPAKAGIYYLEYMRSVGGSVVSFFDFTQKKTSVVFELKDWSNRQATFSVSPDGTNILYSRVDQSQTNFQLVENFK